VQQLRRLVGACQPSVAVSTETFLPFLAEAVEDMSLAFVGTPESFAALPEGDANLRPSEPDELAYLQYTSGSTRFPRGVAVSQRAVMSNLEGITRFGLNIQEGDRAMSWLPFYHDMGLVGFVLGPVASQISVDYLATRDFAMRPRRWLEIMTANRSTIAFSPPFGYELCARRIRPEDVARFDLRSWRTAGVGADTIRPEALQRFADLLEPSGFDRRAFRACYGMAECSLAVSFAPSGCGIEVDEVDGVLLSRTGEAETASAETSERVASFVACGIPLPDLEVEIRDGEGQALPPRRCGTIFVKGPSVMDGYFGDEEATREVLSPDGWLNTGDVGYRMGENVVITGREKDLIIINGRNIWPQDLEYLAEQQDCVRSGDAAAFSVPVSQGGETTVIVVQCRPLDPVERAALVERLRRLAREGYGVDCFIDLVPPHTLPRTSSGKPSRSGARAQFLERMGGTESWLEAEEVSGLAVASPAG
jgi:fatty-acyl-CoA synthase